MEAEELMNEMLAEADRFDDLQAMGNYSASPFSPGAVAARFKELGASAVPYLIACVEGGGAKRRWALVALEAIGTAARAASDALVAQLAADPWVAATLYTIDPERALAMQLHLARAGRAC